MSNFRAFDLDGREVNTFVSSPSFASNVKLN